MQDSILQMTKFIKHIEYYYAIDYHKQQVVKAARNKRILTESCIAARIKRLYGWSLRIRLEDTVLCRLACFSFLREERLSHLDLANTADEPVMAVDVQMKLASAWVNIHW